MGWEISAPRKAYPGGQLMARRQLLCWRGEPWGLLQMSNHQQGAFWKQGCRDPSQGFPWG